MREIVLAGVVCAGIVPAIEPARADEQALQLLKLSLACSAPGTHGKKDRNFNYSFKLAYQYKGDEHRFVVRETHRRIGEENGRAVSDESFLEAKVDFHAVTVSSEGREAKLKCKSTDDCIEYISSIMARDHKTTNVVIRESTHEWEFDFCNEATAQDFEAAFGELAK